MGIFGSAVGGALGIGGSIFGGISASKAMKQVKKNLETQQRENTDWYNRNINEDATQRADAQHIITKLTDTLKQRGKQAAGTAAVTGATEESLAAEKAANAQALADATAQIAVAGDRRKDQIESQYLQTKSDLNDKINNMEANRAQAVAEAVQGVAKAGADMAGLF